MAHAGAFVACEATPSAEPPEECASDYFRDDAGICVPLGCEPGETIPNADAVVHEGESIQAAADDLVVRLSEQFPQRTLALTAGTWAETLTLTASHNGISIVGRCPELTTLDGRDGGDDSATVWINVRAGQGYTLSGLTLTGGHTAGLDSGNANVTLTDVAVRANRQLGVRATSGAYLTLTDVLIADQLPNDDGEYGEGLSLTDGTLDATRVTVRGNRLVGLSLDGAVTYLDDVKVTETQGPNAPQDGMGVVIYGGFANIRNSEFSDNGYAGLYVSEGGQVDGTGVRIEDNVGFGIVATDAGAVVTLGEASLSGTRALNGDVSGIGAFVTHYASLSLTNSEVRDNAFEGIGAFANATLALSGVDVEGLGIGGTEARIGIEVSHASTADLTDVWVHGVTGYGLEILHGSAATLTDVDVVDNAGTGVAIGESGTSVTMTGGEVSRTRNESDNTVGTAIQVGDGAQFSAVGTLFRDNAGMGVGAFGDATQVTLSGVSISGTGAGLAGYGAGAVRVEDGAEAALIDTEIVDNIVVGIGVQDAGTNVSLENVLVSGTRTGPDYVGGEGILLQRGAGLTGNFIVLDDNRVAGLGVSGAHANVTDCRVSRMRPDDESLGGGGVAVQDGGTASLTRCELVENEYLSASVSGAGSALYLNDVSILRPVRYPILDIAVGVLGIDGARVTADNLLIDGVGGAAVMATGAGTQAFLSATTIRGTHAGAGGVGVALEVTAGATVFASGLDVSDTQGSLVTIAGEGSFAEITDAVFSRTSACPAYGDAIGIIAHSGGVAEVSDTTFTETNGPALIGGTGGVLSCTRCVISGSTFAGAAVSDGVLSMIDSRIDETGPDASFGGGVGVYARKGGGGSQLFLRGTMVSSSSLAGLWLDGPEVARVEGCSIAGGPLVDVREGLGVSGNAIFARGMAPWDGVHGLYVGDTWLGDAEDAAVLLDGGSGVFDGAVWEGNGVDVVQQRCDGVVLPTGLEFASTELCVGAERLILPLVYDTFLTEVVPLSE